MSKEFRNFKWEVRRNLGNLSRNKNWAAFFGLIERAVKEIESNFGFTLIMEENSGIVCFSPEGQEIYREIPNTKEWKENVLKLMLYEVD